jgi:hypothetical protein
MEVTMPGTVNLHSATLKYRILLKMHMDWKNSSKRLLRLRIVVCVAGCGVGTFVQTVMLRRMVQMSNINLATSGTYNAWRQLEIYKKYCRIFEGRYKRSHTLGQGLSSIEVRSYTTCISDVHHNNDWISNSKKAAEATDSDSNSSSKGQQMPEHINEKAQRTKAKIVPTQITEVNWSTYRSTMWR